MIFPKVILTSSSRKKQKTSYGKTFLVDFSKAKFLKQDGRMIKTADARSVRMWIEKVLLTRKGHFKIYDRYGTGYFDLIAGKRFPQGFLYAELKREMEEILMEHPEIKNIQKFNAELRRNQLYVSFDVKLTDGSVFPWEVYL